MNYFEKNKGITLISLIVTIVVLLILAGITISSLTGSDSAPAKGNEASQKNDIGAAKDDISLAVVNAKMQGMENAYVENGVSASESQNAVGRTVIQAVADKYATNNQIGNATIDIDVPKTNNVISDNATILISTTDFEVEGTITLKDGVLTWGEIEPNTPRIKLNKNELRLAPGEATTLTVKFKQLEETTIEWSTSNANVATVSNGVVTIKTTANDNDTAIITAKAINGDKEYTALCDLTVFIHPVQATKAMINTANIIGQDISYTGYSSSYSGGWQIFYATENEVFIIAKDLVNTNWQIPLKANNSNTNYEGSFDVRNSNYGKVWNSKWLENCKGVNDSDKSNESTGYNAKRTAYLCDINNWQEFVAQPATYAVGGPTIELLAASVKAKGVQDVVNNLSSTDSTGYSNPFSTSLGYPYMVDWKIWYIASPSNKEDDYNRYMFYVVNNGLVNDAFSNNKQNNMGIRPLVSIPMDNVKIIGNKVEIDK